MGGTIESLVVMCFPFPEAKLEFSRDFRSRPFVSCNCFIETAGTKLAPVLDRRWVGRMLDLEIVVILFAV